MGLFSSIPTCELGEQKYYMCTGCVQTFVHNCHVHLLVVSKIKGLYGLHKQIVTISAPSSDFIM